MDIGILRRCRMSLSSQLCTTRMMDNFRIYSRKDRNSIGLSHCLENI
jgi:hypothetical protein